LARDANHTYLRNTRVFLNTHVARLTLRRQPLLAALVSNHRFEVVPSSMARRPLSHVSASCLRGRATEQPWPRRVTGEVSSVGLYERQSGLVARHVSASAEPSLALDHWYYWYWYTSIWLS